MTMRRLPVRPTEVVDRSRELGFRFNGTAYRGYAGDTIASALAAGGVQVFSRSFKYHRPRGIMTAGWLDPNLMLQVGDDPNVRGGHRLLAEGLDVHSQDAWPSLSYDVKSVNGMLGRFLSPGFYYKTFIRPQRLWPAYEAVLKRFVHAGHVDVHTPHVVRDKTFHHADVVVVGGGPAGMTAALAAADAGAAEVLLVDEDHDLGGYWRAAPEHHAALEDLRQRVRAHASISVYTDTVAIGRYAGNWLGLTVRSPDGSERLVKSRAKTLVVAPGLVERPFVFSGNDLPGVLLGTGVRRLVNLYAVRPGERAVVMTANAHGDRVAEDLASAGVEVAAVVDAREGRSVQSARGRRGVESVTLGDGTTLDADLLVLSTGWTAPTSLLNMAGDRPVYDPQAARFFSGSLPDDVMVTGVVAGDGDTEQLVAHATATGREAARRAARIVRSWTSVPTRGPDAPQLPEAGDPIEVPSLPRDPHPELFRAGDGFVDFSEDVSSADLRAAVREGYDSSELAKRYSTATMGPLQGKLETVNAVAAIAEARGSTIADTGTTTWRPPYAPTTLGALAGRSLTPTRRSPMHDWHEAHGAVPLVAGAWIRPEHYGDPAAEVRSVRNDVGIIDVTPLGKLDLRGPDVPDLLELLYVNKWQRLGVGQVRYGVMCAEDGVVFDDGVTGRLGEQHYLMSTTSGGAAAVWEWVENWLQTGGRGLRVHCTPVTTAYASINVAGPKARTLLSRLTELDLDGSAFPYMNVRVATVAGVADVVVWRIGFTGELSYEIHVPAGYGQHVWDELLRHGEDLGVRAFGVEAQRVLRLEKGHFIVGQDTDGLTQAFSADLGWLVKLDKPDFVGAPELRWQQERGPASRLVALRPTDGTVVPAEASQVVDERSRIIGRITSSRMSPTLGRSICLGQVLTEHARPGSRLRVLLPSGDVVTAEVCEELAQVDPDGGRARG